MRSPVQAALLALVLGVSASASPARAGVPTDDGYPAEPERALLVLTNAARQAPQVWCAHCQDDCGAYPEAARAPYVYDARLGRAARFHAKHIHDTPCFQHASCCELERVDGEVRCASPPVPSCNQCDSGDCPGTSFSTRIALFDYPLNAGVAENIAAGRASVEQTVCQWLRSPGHRNNVYGGLRALGTGFYGGSGCYRSYWVQKFGGVAGEVPPIPAGSLVDGGWYAVNWVQAPVEGDDEPPPPQSAVVVEDGRCRHLQLEWGTVENGTWTYGPAATGGGCATYWFRFVDADGEVHVYPSEGALGTGRDCPAWVPTRPAADCVGGDDPPGDDPPGDDPPGDDPPGDDPPGDDPPGDDPPGDDPPGDDPPGDDPPGDDPPGDDSPGDGPGNGSPDAPDGTGDGDPTLDGDEEAGGGGGAGRDLWAPLGGGCTSAGGAPGTGLFALFLVALAARLNRRGARPSARP